MTTARLRPMLGLHEGKTLLAYLDTEGILSIGIGHNCIAKPVAGVKKVGNAITMEQMHELFDADVGEAFADLDRYLPWWRALDDVRQDVLADMCFNMGIGNADEGTGLLGFRNTLAAVRMGDYEGAADRMLQSRWSRQVGKRAKRLSDMMRTGIYADDVPEEG